MIKFFILLLLTGLLSCQHKEESRRDEKSDVDTSANVSDTTTAMFKFNAAQMSMFDKTASPVALTSQELNKIDSLLAVGVADHNKNIGQNLQSMKIDLVGRLYKKQLVAVVNSRGIKEVWVNCFCDDSAIPWKTELLMVSDGGSCYFNFKVNLKSQKYYEFSVNGLA